VKRLRQKEILSLTSTSDMSQVRRTESSMDLLKDLSLEVQNLDHVRKLAPCQARVMEGEVRESSRPPRAASATMSTMSESTQTTTQKKSHEIDVTKDIIQRLKKEAGGYNYIPLSIGKLGDIWWRPIRVESFEKTRGSVGIPMCVIYTQIFIDSPKAFYDSEHFIAFKADAEEVLKVSFLLHTCLRETEGSKRLSFDEWRGEMMRVIDMEKCSSDAEFAKKVFTAVYKTCDEKLPSWCKVFMMKKPTTQYIFPEGSQVHQNLNSVACQSTSGFKFEYRARMLFCVPTTFEEDEPPLTQPLF